MMTNFSEIFRRLQLGGQTQFRREFAEDLHTGTLRDFLYKEIG